MQVSRREFLASCCLGGGLVAALSTRPSSKVIEVRNENDVYELQYVPELAGDVRVRITTPSEVITGKVYGQHYQGHLFIDTDDGRDLIIPGYDREHSQVVATTIEVLS